MLEDLLQEIDDDVRENTPVVFTEYHLADPESQAEIRVSTAYRRFLKLPMHRNRTYFTDARPSHGPKSKPVGTDSSNLVLSCYATSLATRRRKLPLYVTLRLFHGDRADGVPRTYNS